MKRYRDIDVNFRFPTVVNSASSFLALSLASWKRSRQNVVNDKQEKKKHSNWPRLEARSDKQNQYYYHCLTYLLSVPNDSGVTKTENAK